MAQSSLRQSAVSKFELINFSPDTFRESTYTSDDVRTIMHIADGVFSKVYVVLVHGAEHQEFAAKIQPYHVKFTWHCDMARHWKILKRLKNIGFNKFPGVVPLHLAWMEEGGGTHKKHSEVCYFIMDLCGDLNAHTLQEQDLWKLVHDISSALKSLHHHHLLHMDVKPSNIVKARSPEQAFQYKLTDLCHVYELDPDSKSAIEPNDGDGRFCAPEVIRNATEAWFPSDVFSLGATIYEISAEAGFSSGNGSIIRDLDGVPHLKSKIRIHSLDHLVRKMCEFEPSKRPNCDEIIALAKAELTRLCIIKQ